MLQLLGEGRQSLESAWPDSDLPLYRFTLEAYALEQLLLSASY